MNLCSTRLETLRRILQVFCSSNTTQCNHAFIRRSALSTPFRFEFLVVQSSCGIHRFGCCLPFPLLALLGTFRIHEMSENCAIDRLIDPLHVSEQSARFYCQNWNARIVCVEILFCRRRCDFRKKRSKYNGNFYNGFFEHKNWIQIGLRTMWTHLMRTKHLRTCN